MIRDGADAIAMLLVMLIGALVAAAWVTSIIVCISKGWYLAGLAVSMLVPFAVVHGVWFWHEWLANGVLLWHQ
jgi:hypothetical protein